MKTTHGSFTRSAGAPIHHHRGSCQGNIRRKYSFSSFFLLFTWAVASEILEDNQDISYFTYSLRFYSGRVLDRKFCLCVCLCVRLSVNTFSFSDYWIIWWFTACKPYIFWKHITLVTSTALFWPSTTKYQPVPQYTDPVPPSNNRDK